MEPPVPAFDAHLAAARRRSRGATRRAAWACLGLGLYRWHFFHDTWWDTPPMAGLYVAVGVGILLICGRVSRGFAALAFLGQPAVIAVAKGVQLSVRGPDDGATQHAVYRFGGPDPDGCLVLPGSRLWSCPTRHSVGCVRPLVDYTGAAMLAQTVAETFRLWTYGAPATGYGGPLPTADQLRTILVSAGVPVIREGAVLPAAAALGLPSLGVESPLGFDHPDADAARLGPDTWVVGSPDLTVAELRWGVGGGALVPGYGEVDLRPGGRRGDEPVRF